MGHFRQAMSPNQSLMPSLIAASASPRNVVLLRSFLAITRDVGHLGPLHPPKRRWANVYAKTPALPSKGGWPHWSNPFFSFDNCLAHPTIYKNLPFCTSPQSICLSARWDAAWLMNHLSQLELQMYLVKCCFFTLQTCGLCLLLLGTCLDSGHHLMSVLTKPTKTTRKRSKYSSYLNSFWHMKNQERASSPICKMSIKPGTNPSNETGACF